ncbi:MAG: dihydroorotase [Phycisphaerales bacterium JB039]
MSSTVIAGGRIIDPATGFDAIADLVITDGRIARLGPDIGRTGADRVVDAAGCLVTPGLIDPHVHLREPGQTDKETLATGGAAAAAGGFTAVCCMPNTSPALDSPEMLDVVRFRSRDVACRIFPVGAATLGRQGAELAPIAMLVRAGAVGISDDGDVVASSRMMRRALQACAEAQVAFMQHCQDPELTVGAVMHAGAVSARLGLTGWPREAEELIIERDLRLNRAVGARYHVQHLSSAGSIEIVRAARARGEPITAEASPHHLLLTDEWIDQDGFPNPLGKVNPPLREMADVEAIRAAVAEGVITVLGTDHAPHTRAEKELPIEDAPFGMIGLEFALPLYAEALVHSGLIGWPRLIALMTVEPARLCGLDRLGLGRLEVGGPADVTIIDPEAQWTITEGELAGKSANTPFLGRTVRGRAVATIVAGTLRQRTGAPV